jgi:AAA15 family ATPase/GTPase
LLFEEPEAHAFPAYVQLLADEMGRDTHNQYFITTHNPYFVETLLEEEYRNEVGIFLTYYEDYQTEVKKLGKGEIDNLIGNDADLFSNLNAYKA